MKALIATICVAASADPLAYSWKDDQMRGGQKDDGQSHFRITNRAGGKSSVCTSQDVRAYCLRNAKGGSMDGIAPACLSALPYRKPGDDDGDSVADTVSGRLFHCVVL